MVVRKLALPLVIILRQFSVVTSDDGDDFSIIVCHFVVNCLEYLVPLSLLLSSCVNLAEAGG